MLHHPGCNGITKVPTWVGEVVAVVEAGVLPGVALVGVVVSAEDDQEVVPAVDGEISEVGTGITIVRTKQRF